MNASADGGAAALRSGCCGAGAFAEHRRLHPRISAISYAVDAVFRVGATLLIVIGGAAIVWTIVFGHV